MGPNIRSDNDDLDKKYLDETILPKKITDIIKSIKYDNEDATKEIKTKLQSQLEKIDKTIVEQIKKATASKKKIEESEADEERLKIYDYANLKEDELNTTNDKLRVQPKKTADELLKEVNKRL